MKQILLGMYAGVWFVFLAACGIPFDLGKLPDGTLPSASTAQAEGERNKEEVISVTIYVGMDEQFAEYPVKYTGEQTATGQVPAADVLSALAELTGWNLNLADQVYSGRAGVTVTFADDCILLSGELEGNTPEEFAQQEQMVLDSIKRTLQCWAVDPNAGDPDTVDIWFCGPDGENLVLTGSGITISSTEPYRSFPSAEESW